MNFQLRLSRLACLLVLVAITSSTKHAMADIVVVDPIDGSNVTTTHLGFDSIGVNVIAANVFARVNVTGGNMGIGSSGVGYTSGTDFDVVADNSFVNYLSTTFQGGAGPGLNYARFDLDFDSVYETVLEIDFGIDTNTGDDKITRYAYDDGFANLEISDAVSAFSVPEPGAASLFLLCGMVAANRRVRRKK